MSNRGANTVYGAGLTMAGVSVTPWSSVDGLPHPLLFSEISPRVQRLLLAVHGCVLGGRCLLTHDLAA